MSSFVPLILALDMFRGSCLSEDADKRDVLLSLCCTVTDFIGDLHVSYVPFGLFMTGRQFKLEYLASWGGKMCKNHHCY